MHTQSSRSFRCAAAVLAAALCGAPAWGQPSADDSTGRARAARDDVGNRDARMSEVGQGERMGPRVKPGMYIGEKYRVALRAAWKQAYGDGRRCPPGLRKTGTGCAAAVLPTPWVIGDPLPAGAEPHPVPAPLRNHLPQTPEGHRYVLVAGDLLLVATGSGMVVDAVQGLAAP